MSNFHLVLLVSLVFASCSLDTNCLSKDAMVSNLSKFIDDVEKHHDKLQPSDWADIDKEFKSYVETCYPKFKGEMTISEKVDFWKHTLSYGVYRGSSRGSFELDLNVDYRTEIDELTAQGKAEIEAYLRDEFQPDLEKTIDGVVKEVEKLGDELKNWLDNL